MATIFGDVLYIPKSWDIYQPLTYQAFSAYPTSQLVPVGACTTYESISAKQGSRILPMKNAVFSAGWAM